MSTKHSVALLKKKISNWTFCYGPMKAIDPINTRITNECEPRYSQPRFLLSKLKCRERSLEGLVYCQETCFTVA